MQRKINKIEVDDHAYIKDQISDILIKDFRLQETNSNNICVP